MKPHTTLIMALILALLIAGIVAYEKVWKTRQIEKRRESATAYTGLKEDSVAGIEIKKGDTYSAGLVKEPEGWKVASEGNYAADTEGIEKIFDTVKAIRLEELASNNKSMHERLEVDAKNGIWVTISDKDKKPLAKFVVGKRGKAYGSAYFRKADDDQTYLVYQDLQQVFDRSGKTWKDLTVISFSEPDAREMTLQNGNTGMTFSRNVTDNSWEMKEGNTAEKLQKYLMDSMVKSMSNLKAVEFAGSTVTPEAAGLLSPKRKASVKTADNSVYTILVGNENQAKDKIFVKDEKKDTIFACSKYTIDNIFKNKKELIQTSGTQEGESPLPPPELEQNRLDQPMPGALPKPPEQPAETGK